MRIALFEADANTTLTGITDSAFTQSAHCCHIFRRSISLLTQLQRDTFDAIVFFDGSQLSSIGFIKDLKKRYPALPILLISENASVDAFVTAIKAGADSHLSSPSGEKIVAYTEGLTRLARASSNRALDRTNFGDYVFIKAGSVCRTPKGDVTLTPKEFTLALCLFRNLGVEISRDYLTETIWGRPSEMSSRTLDTHIPRLRTKLSLTEENGYLLSAVYSQGYRLDRISGEEMITAFITDDTSNQLDELVGVQSVNQNFGVSAFAVSTISNN